MTELTPLFQAPQRVDTRTGEILTESPVRVLNNYEKLAVYQECAIKYGRLEALAIVFGNVPIGDNVNEADKERALLDQYIKKERRKIQRRKEANCEYEYCEKPPYWTEKLTCMEFRNSGLCTPSMLRGIQEGAVVVDIYGRPWWRITFKLSTRKQNTEHHTKTLYCR